MILGILSDTHDRMDAAAAAVTLLRGKGAGYLIHCGDVGQQRIIDLLVGVPSALVWGNNDWDRRGLAGYCASVDVKCLDDFGQVELDGKVIAVTHGDHAATVRKVLTVQEHDYLLVGHSHIPADQRFGRVRLINPGALHRAARKSVATLDLQTDELRFYDVPSGACFRPTP